MPRFPRLSFALAAACAATAGAARADQVFLKNGDHITGKIVSAADKKLVVKPDFAPDSPITLSQDDVATFETSGPITLKLKDGTVINQAVRKADPGEVAIAPGGALAAQDVTLAQVDLINPPPVAWHGAVGVNGLYANSATSSLLLGVSADGTRRTARDELTAHASYNYGEQSTNDLTTVNANNWGVGAKYSLSLTPKVYAYLGAEATGDSVNFLNLRFTPGGGVGYRWFDKDDFHFKTDAGLAWLYEDYSTRSKTTDQIAASLAYHLDKSWDTKRIVVFNDVQLLPSLEGNKFLAVADAGLRTNLTKSMYSEIRADVTYDSDPAPGAKQTTTQIKIGLGLTY